MKKTPNSEDLDVSENTFLANFCWCLLWLLGCFGSIFLLASVLRKFGADMCLVAVEHIVKNEACLCHQFKASVRHQGGLGQDRKAWGRTGWVWAVPGSLGEYQDGPGQQGVRRNWQQAGV